MDTSNKLRWGLAAVLCALLVAPGAVRAIPFQYDLTFQTTGQSIWDTGSAATLNQTTFLGAAWTDKQSSAGLIVGDDMTPNPLRAAYDLTFAGCTGLGFSSSVCINGQSARVPVPALGSRPGVRSCGTFQFSCQAKRVGDISRRAAYDVAFSACRVAFSSSVCRNGQ